MEEKSSLLICLGAATAANCIPCFEHYHTKASAAGLSPQEILEAVELAAKVKNGAHLVIRSRIKSLLNEDTASPSCGDNPGKNTCCG
jgi:alkylhydroperoxidase/carboxymuconolactone decarboxylase family protein YurZ